MLPIVEIGLLAGLFTPFFISGLGSNSYLIYLIIKNLSSQNPLHLITIPFFISGIVGASLLLPLIILNAVSDIPFLCKAIAIIHCGLQVTCYVTLLSLIITRCFFIFFPQLLSTPSSKKIAVICIVTNISISILLTAFILVLDLLPSLVSSCQITEFPPSSLRFSIFFGVGIFVTVFLWAISNLMDHLTKNEPDRVTG